MDYTSLPGYFCLPYRLVNNKLLTLGVSPNVVKFQNPADGRFLAMAADDAFEAGKVYQFLSPNGQLAQLIRTADDAVLNPTQVIVSRLWGGGASTKPPLHFGNPFYGQIAGANILLNAGTLNDVRLRTHNGNFAITAATVIEPGACLFIVNASPATQVTLTQG